MILLSRGHYQERPGATHNGNSEFVESERWIRRIYLLIKNHGIPVEIVPTGRLSQKVKYINNKKADIAMELHFNSDISKRQHGSETLYYPNSKKGYELATSIQNEFERRAILQPNRGAKEGWYLMDKPGVKEWSGDIEGDEKIDYFLKKTNCVSVIVEPEFIYNADTLINNFTDGSKVIAEKLVEFHQKHF